MSPNIIPNKKILNLKKERKIFLILKFSKVSLLDCINEIQNSLFAKEARTKSLWSPPQLKSPNEILLKKKIDGKIINIVTIKLLNLKSLNFNWKENFGNGNSLNKTDVRISDISRRPRNRLRFLR